LWKWWWGVYELITFERDTETTVTINGDTTTSNESFQGDSFDNTEIEFFTDRTIELSGGFRIVNRNDSNDIEIVNFNDESGTFIPNNTTNTLVLTTTVPSFSGSFDVENFSNSGFIISNEITMSEEGDLATTSITINTTYTFSRIEE